MLCAAPSYLQHRGTLRIFADLSLHGFLITKERDHPFGVGRLRHGKQESTIKVRGALSSNNCEMVVQWNGPSTVAVLL